MRPVLPTDVICAARALLAAPPGARAALARSLVAEAQMADRHRLQTGQAHPVHGDGTLSAAALRLPLATPRDLCDPGFASAMIAVLQAIQARRVQDRAGHSASR